MRGVTTELPNNKNNNSYQIKWDASSGKVPIDITDLRTSFSKDDNMHTIMKLARIKHNKQYDIQPTFHLPATKKVTKKKKVTNKELAPKTRQPKKKKKKTTKRTPAKTPDKRALCTRADFQMTPVQSPNDIAGDTPRRLNPQ